MERVGLSEWLDTEERIDALAETPTSVEDEHLSELSDTESRMAIARQVSASGGTASEVDPAERPDTGNGIAPGEVIRRPSPLGAGFLILVTRELAGLTQRELASHVGTSQPSLATLESGNRIPTLRTLLRIAGATGFDLVIGLHRPGPPRPEPEQIHALGFDLLGVLEHNAQDGLADFDVLREPSPLEGPEDEPAGSADPEDPP